MNIIGYIILGLGIAALFLLPELSRPAFAGYYPKSGLDQDDSAKNAKKGKHKPKKEKGEDSMHPSQRVWKNKQNHDRS